MFCVFFFSLFLLEKHLISSDLISSSESPERFVSDETAGFELYPHEGYHHLTQSSKLNYNRMKYGCHIHRTKATTYPDHSLLKCLITLTEVTVSSHLLVPYHDKVPSHTAPQIPGISLPGTKHVWAFTH